jgi:5-methylcytosine-specific restriction enzyme subunit McrC
VNRLTLAEYQPLSGCDLSREQCDALRLAVPSIRVEPTAGRPGFYDLTPGSWIGAVEVGDIAIVIRPKIKLEHVLFLLSYSLDPASWRGLPFDLQESESIADAVVPAFVFQIRRAVRRGLLQHYRAEEDALHTLRGRLDFSEHVRAFGLAPPLHVRFDEFTEDHVLNRLIKCALLCLERTVVRSEYARRLLHGSLPLFERVRHVPFHPGQLPDIVYTRLTEHYRPAVELAKFIIRSTSFEQHHGAVASRSFLVNMNDVFESFVAIALQEALGLSDRTLRRNATLHLDTGGRVALQPDLSWWERGRPVFVGDAKYKALYFDGYRHADLYQLLAYVTACDLPNGLLVYSSGEGLPGSYQVRHCGRSLEVRWLRLEGTPSTILASVQDLAAAVQVMRRDNLLRVA